MLPQPVFSLAMPSLGELRGNGVLGAEGDEVGRADLVPMGKVARSDSDLGVGIEEFEHGALKNRHTECAGYYFGTRSVPATICRRHSSRHTPCADSRLALSISSGPPPRVRGSGHRLVA